MPKYPWSKIHFANLDCLFEIHQAIEREMAGFIALFLYCNKLLRSGHFSKSDRNCSQGRTSTEGFCKIASQIETSSNVGSLQQDLPYCKNVCPSIRQAQYPAQKLGHRCFAIKESKHVKANDIEKIVHQKEKKIEELNRIEAYAKKKLV